MSLPPLEVQVDVQDNASNNLESIGSRCKDLVTSFAGVATAAFSLYQSYENVENSSVALDRANVTVEKSQRSLTTAQETADKTAQNLSDAHAALTVAIDKYGAGSKEATDAQTKLDEAQQKADDAATNLTVKTDALQVATERQSLAQRNYNDSVMQAVTFALPSLITLGDKIYTMYGNWSASASQVAEQEGLKAGKIGEESTASEAASSSGSNLTGVMGGLAAGAAVLGTNITLTNERLKDMKDRGVEVSQTEETWTQVTGALCGWQQSLIGYVTSASAKMYDNAEAEKSIAENAIKTGTNIDQLTQALLRLGFTKDQVEAITADFYALKDSADATKGSVDQLTNSIQTVSESLYTYQQQIANVTPTQSTAIAVASTASTGKTLSTAQTAAGATSPLEHTPTTGEAGGGWYQHGFEGVIDRPTLMGVGEAGPEEVSIRPAGSRQGGNMLHATVNNTIYITSSDKTVEQEVDIVNRGVSEALRRMNY